MTRKSTNLATAVLLGALAGFSAFGCSRQNNAAGQPAGVPPLAPAPAAAFAGEALIPGAHEQPVEAEAVPDAPDPSRTISGIIVLPAANRARVARGDIMFLAARRAGGPPGPGSMLAVQKLQADEFPVRFTISDRDAMIPGVAFDGPVTITVRVDKDGDAMTRRRGDLFGQATNIRVGAQKVVISLDTLQTEDRTLPGGPGALAGGAFPR